jgi:hypothetical protein
VHSREVRGLLERYSQGRPTSKCLPLPDQETLDQLIQMLWPHHHDATSWEAHQPAQTSAQVIAELLVHLPSVECEGGIICPPMSSSLLYHLSSNHTSDTVLIHSDNAHNVLKEMVLKWTASPEQGSTMEDVDAAGVLDIDAHELYLFLNACQSLICTHGDVALCKLVLDLLHFLLELYHKVIGGCTSEDSRSIPISEVPAAQREGVHGLVCMQQSLTSLATWSSAIYTRPQYLGLEHENGRSKDNSVYRSVITLSHWSVTANASSAQVCLKPVVCTVWWYGSIF